MIKRLILHIGLPKTATSSLQRCLWKGRNTMKEARILYPETCLFHDRSHHPVFFEIEGINAWHTNKSAEHSYLRELQKEVELCNPEIVILSSEVSANLNPARILTALTPALDGWFNIDLLAAFRNVYAFAFSGYLQKIKDPVIGHVSTYADYFKSPAALRDFSGALTWYRAAKILPYDSRFITEFFDPKLSRVPFLDYFSDLTGCDLGKDDDLHVNKSPSIQKHLLFLAANRRSKGDPELSKALRKRIDKLFSDPSTAMMEPMKELQERCQKPSLHESSDLGCSQLHPNHKALNNNLRELFASDSLDDLFMPEYATNGLDFDAMYSENEQLILRCLSLADD